RWRPASAGPRPSDPSSPLPPTPVALNRRSEPVPAPCQAAGARVRLSRSAVGARNVRKDRRAGEAITACPWRPGRGLPGAAAIRLSRQGSLEEIGLRGAFPAGRVGDGPVRAYPGIGVQLVGLGAFRPEDVDDRDAARDQRIRDQPAMAL